MSDDIPESAYDAARALDKKFNSDWCDVSFVDIASAMHEYAKQQEQRVFEATREACLQAFDADPDNKTAEEIIMSITLADVKP